MKEKIVVLVVAIALVILMFQLPRVVVNNNEAEFESAASSMSPAANTSHNTLTDPAVIEKIDSVRGLWRYDDFSENNSIFANYLAQEYLRTSQYDSAITYFEWLNEHFPGRKNKEGLASAYYKAFSFEMNPSERQDYALKARELYEELLAESPDNLDLENKLAMTYVIGSSPMEGIMRLRKILEKDSTNAEALLNLGILAIQTAQYDRAEEHLGKLVESHPEHWQGHLLLGAAMLEHGHEDEARPHFVLVKEKGDDPALVEAAENYLKKL